MGHLLQPKRSERYAEASLPQDADPRQDERHVFERVKEIIRKAEGEGAVFEIEQFPSFVPYLLDQEPESPEDLLKTAVGLRKHSTVVDCRQWRSGLIREWRERGKVSAADVKKIKGIVSAAKRDFRARESINVSLGINFIDPSLNVPLKGLYGWVFDGLSGKRYVKLLTRMVAADWEYGGKPAAHLMTLWNNN